jgi:hypothetical protein
MDTQLKEALQRAARAVGITAPDELLAKAIADPNYDPAIDLMARIVEQHRELQAFGFTLADNTWSPPSDYHG